MNNKIKWPNGHVATIEEVTRCVGPGWTAIIQSLITDLFEMGWNGNLDQVKEKYGSVDFYISKGTKAMHDRIEQVKSDSMNTCELCGQPGKIQKIGAYWLFCRCDSCRVKQEQKHIT